MKFRQNDVLLLYVISPVKRIMGICRVTSHVFRENKKDPWLDRSYPHRVKISEVEPFEVSSKEFIGKVSFVGKRIPRGSSVIPVSQDDFLILKKLAKYG